MKTSDDLRKLLLTIDRRSYPAYKDTRGQWSYAGYTLSIDHVQGDPFASPSSVSVIVPGLTALFPADYLLPKHRRLALQDMLLRFFSRELSKRASERQRVTGSDRSSTEYYRAADRGRDHGAPQRDGSGKSGLIAVSRPGQEVLERTACRVDPHTGDVTLRFEIGFPANGRTINAKALIRILDDFLPNAVAASLFYRNVDKKKLQEAIDLSDDQQYIREVLEKKGLCAFVGDGAVLPRESGVSSQPLKDAVPFLSPESMAVTLDLPHAGPVRGMGIPRGVTLIVGGGYHGKSTLLNALEKGVYNHILGDGREYVITDGTAAKIRAEDGRSITNVDISLFIRDLPGGQDTVRFSSQDASGSTSQAANVIEAVEAGARLLLIDEDTSATNFMVRDELMARVVSKNKEPITPFISRIRDLYEKAGVSTILVAGSSGAFFHVADTVVQMDRYVPFEITAAAKAALRQGDRPFDAASDPQVAAGRTAAAASQDAAGRTAAAANQVAADLATQAPADATVYRAPDFRLPSAKRIPRRNGALLREGRLKVKTLSEDSFLLAHDQIDLRGLEQLVDREQVSTLALILKYAELHMIDGRQSFDEVLELIMSLLDSEGLEELFDGSTVRCGLAAVRQAEVAGMLNRYRKL